jgi:hypothetical protein
MFKPIAILILCTCSLSAQQPGTASPLQPPQLEKDSPVLHTEWYQATKITLVMEREGAKVEKVFEFTDRKDMRITIDESDSAGHHDVTQILLINGPRKWMLYKGAALEAGKEFEAADTPILEMKTALELLRSVLPEGPLKITTKTPIKVSEKTRKIEVSTPHSAGAVDPPWSLRGTVEPIGESEWAFDLVLTTNEGIPFKGTWQKSAKPLSFADDLPLKGWQIFVVGTMMRSDGDRSAFDYGAQPIDDHPATLGTLRNLKSK